MSSVSWRGLHIVLLSSERKRKRGGKTKGFWVVFWGGNSHLPVVVVWGGGRKGREGFERE